MKRLRLLDLFSGIGGFSLGLERSGYFETVAFCEIEPFPRKILKKHWPEVPCYEDVRTLTAARLAADGIGVDAICGGFPCQDISTAGKQAGIGKGTRSGLFSEVTRLAGELRPSVIILENVSNLLSGPSKQRGGWFGTVLGALAEIGYDAEWHCIPAENIGAHHERDRVWIIAHTNSAQCQRRCISGRIYAQYADTSYSCWGPDKPGLDRASYGVPDQLDRLKAIGNAVVPQIPELLGRAIGQAMFDEVPA